MIHFVVTETGSFSIRGYLVNDGSVLADRMRVVSYSELAHMRQLPLGTWVFTELDQLDAPRHELAVLAAERLAAHGNGARILNDPRHVLLRAELLRAAHEAGVNQHRAWQVADVLLDAKLGTHLAETNISAASLRYPVFVRFANQHVGNLTSLLDSPRALYESLVALAADGLALDELLIVEFADTKDEHGVYRKYAAYNVGGRIIARSLEQSRDWMVKWRRRIYGRERADEELTYCERNPHEQWIREMFGLARIEYGRIDYGMLRGRPQLWEINTNPTIAGGPNPNRARPPEAIEYRAMIAPARATFYDEFNKAWAAVDTRTDEGPPVDMAIPDALVRAIDRAERHRRAAERVGSLLDIIARQRWMRPMARVAKRALAPILLARLRALR